MESTDRSIAAEARAVEEGHHAFLARDTDGVYVKVKSDSTDGRWYRVVAHTLGGVNAHVTFTCRASDIGAPGRRKDHGNGVVASVDGTTPCKHAALAARRLERAGLIRWIDPHTDQGIAYSGRWVGAVPTSPVVMDELAETEQPQPEPGERKASDAPGYRDQMRRLVPTPNTTTDPWTTRAEGECEIDEDAEAFALFAGSDQR